MITILRLDIGGANVKAVGLDYEPGMAPSFRAISLPFEIWREIERLPLILRSAQTECIQGAKVDALAVTMTAELADVFATKREGVRSHGSAIELEPGWFYCGSQPGGSRFAGPGDSRPQ